MECEYALINKSHADVNGNKLGTADMHPTLLLRRVHGGAKIDHDRLFKKKLFVRRTSNQASRWTHITTY